MLDFLVLVTTRMESFLRFKIGWNFGCSYDSTLAKSDHGADSPSSVDAFETFSSYVHFTCGCEIYSLFKRNECQRCLVGELSSFVVGIMTNFSVKE